MSPTPPAHRAQDKGSRRSDTPSPSNTQSAPPPSSLSATSLGNARLAPSLPSVRSEAAASTSDETGDQAATKQSRWALLQHPLPPLPLPASCSPWACPPPLHPPYPPSHPLPLSLSPFHWVRLLSACCPACLKCCCQEASCPLLCLQLWILQPRCLLEPLLHPLIVTKSNLPVKRATATEGLGRKVQTCRCWLRPCQRYPRHRDRRPAQMRCCEECRIKDGDASERVRETRLRAGDMSESVPCSPITTTPRLKAIRNIRWCVASSVTAFTLLINPYPHDQGLLAAMEVSLKAPQNRNLPFWLWTSLHPLPRQTGQ